MTLEHFDVAVGVILNAANEVLIAKRPPGKFMPGLWEFPGGKLESGESAEVALHRELVEELAIDISDPEHFMTVEEDYAEQNRHVRLHVYIVRQFKNDPKGVEGQALRWCAFEDLGKYTFPSANHPIIEALLRQD